MKLYTKLIVTIIFGIVCWLLMAEAHALTDSKAAAMFKLLIDGGCVIVALWILGGVWRKRKAENTH